MSVSVIIPTYNDSGTISRAISSALGQTISVDEIIVVDDASKDDTKTVVGKFDDNRIRYVRHNQNQGGSAARNTGLEHASGDYIAYLDADDEWLPRKLEKQLEVLQSRSNEWVASHCDRTWDVSLRSKIGFALSTLIGSNRHKPLKEGGEELIKEVLTLNLSTGASTLVVKRETVEEIGGFDPRFPRHQDWEFLIRILKNGKLAYIDEPLVIKHKTGNPSIEKSREGKRLLLSVFADEVTTLEAEGIDVTYIQQLQLSKLYIAAGEFIQGFRQIDLEKLTLREFLSVLWYIPDGVYNRISD